MKFTLNQKHSNRNSSPSTIFKKKRREQFKTKKKHKMKLKNRPNIGSKYSCDQLNKYHDKYIFDKLKEQNNILPVISKQNKKQTVYTLFKSLLFIMVWKIIIFI